MEILAAKRVVPSRRIAFTGVAEIFLALGHRDPKLQREAIENLSRQTEPCQTSMRKDDIDPCVIDRLLPVGGCRDLRYQTIQKRSRVRGVVDSQENIRAEIRHRPIANDGCLDVSKVESLRHCRTIKSRR